VKLVGGRGPFEGNVMAFNPFSGIFGPVCQHTFDFKAVSPKKEKERQRDTKRERHRVR